MLKLQQNWISLIHIHRWIRKNRRENIYLIFDKPGDRIKAKLYIMHVLSNIEKMVPNEMKYCFNQLGFTNAGHVSNIVELKKVAPALYFANRQQVTELADKDFHCDYLVDEDERFNSGSNDQSDEDIGDSNESSDVSGNDSCEVSRDESSSKSGK